MAGYEKSDVNAPKVIIFSFVGVVILAAILFLYNYYLAEKEELVYEQQLKPESVSLRELRSTEEETLTSYKVLNAEKGIYQIPVDRAMQLLAEENFKQKMQGH